MSSSPERKVTVKLDSWFVDREVIRTVGYTESPHFGTESTSFYWRAKVNGDFYTLELFLSSCQVAKVYVEVKYWLGKKPLTEEDMENVDDETLKGQVSLDKKEKIEDVIYKNASFFIFTEITFDEPDGTFVGFLQLKHFKALSGQLGSFRENVQSDALVTLVTTVDGREFTANKGMLAARSTVFGAMFAHAHLQESQENRVQVDDITGEVMEALLKYVYAADVEGIEAIADKLLKAADKYDLPLLVEECAQSLVNSLTVDTAARCFYLADLYRLEHFKKQVVSFIAKNRQQVRESDGWKQHIGFDQIQQLFDLKI